MDRESRKAWIESDIRRTAIHEAAHGVFAWRTGADVHGAHWNEDWPRPPFDEIVISRRRPSRIRLSDGRLISNPGIVAGRHDHAWPGAVEMYRRMLREWERDPEARFMRDINGNKAGRLSRGLLRTWFTQAKLAAMAEILVSLAGSVAEYCEDGFWYDWQDNDSWDDSGGNSADADLNTAFKFAEELGGSRRGAVRVMYKAVASIEDAIENDPRVWRTITATADALVKRGRLSGDHAMRIIRTAWRNDQNSAAATIPATINASASGDRSGPARTALRA